MALFWAVGLVTILQLINRLLPAGGARFVHPLQVLAALVAIAPALFAAAGDTRPLHGLAKVLQDLHQLCRALKRFVRFLPVEDRDVLFG